MKTRLHGKVALWISRRSACQALCSAAWTGLAWAAPAPAAGQSWPATPTCISRIRLESHRRGEPPFVLELQRGGSAVFTRLGSGREGTEDAVQTGQLDGRHFEKLARRVIALGFFEWQETYEAPDLRDGPWSATTVTCDARDKSVFSRLDAGPPALRALEQAIAAQRRWMRPDPGPQ